MRQDEIDEVLLRTLDDGRLSRGERRVLTELLSEQGEERELLAFFRHRAFAVARERLSDPRAVQLLDWLEEVLKAAAQAEEQPGGERLAEAHFSPGDHCRRRIVSLIGQARRNVEVCVFTITDDRIARALRDAHIRGVRVRIITDDDKATDRGSDIQALSDAGITVRTDHSEHHMHHKFAIVDGSYLLTGSYNWTRSAASFNEENIVVSNEPRLVRAFTETFESLWRAFALPG